MEGDKIMTTQNFRKYTYYLKKVEIGDGMVWGLY